jgi:hypothetical protein
MRDRATIRIWALQQDLPVNARGRLPREIVEQYDCVHKRDLDTAVAELVAYGEELDKLRAEGKLSGVAMTTLELPLAILNDFDYRAALQKYLR